MKKSPNNYALIFAGLNIPDEEKFRVGEEIKKVGGLSFSVRVNKEGWYAQCDQIDGIFAANSNPSPTNAELEAEIRQAIMSAFNVRVLKPKIEKVQSPFKFEYEIPKIA